MTPLLLATTLAAASQPPAPDRVPVECTVSRKAAGSREGTRAIVCGGVRGFFVARDAYLKVRRLEREHPFLKREIQILEDKAEALEAMARAGRKVEGANLRLATTYQGSWTQCEDSLRAANKDVRSMASLSVWERLGWLSLGVAVVGAAWLLGRDDGSPTIVVPR